MVFNIILHRVPVTTVWKSEGAEVNPHAAQLQELFDDNVEAYQSELKKLENEGHKFRLADGRVYELLESTETMEVPIKLQIKEGTITWYFLAPNDVTKQSFRDEVYRSAALAHLKVKNACEKYLRGTNSLHVKKMHTNESEAGLNHNHYRLLDGHDVTPEDLRQHLMGFIEAEQNQKLFVDGSAGKKTEKYLTLEEANAILGKFEEHWTVITHKGPAKTINVNGKPLKLPQREKSLLEEYKAKEYAKWTPEDIEEWEKYKDLEQPCRSIDNTKPFEEQLKAAEKGMRSLRSEVAHERQMAGSRLKVIQTNFAKNDSITKVSTVAIQRMTSKSEPNKPVSFPSATPPPMMKTPSTPHTPITPMTPQTPITPVLTPASSTSSVPGTPLPPVMLANISEDAALPTPIPKQTPSQSPVPPLDESDKKDIPK